MTKNLQQLQNQLSKTTTHIFDMDGTLVDLEQLNFSTFEQTIREKLNREFTQQEYQQYFSGAGSRNGFISYTKAHALDYPIDDLVHSYRSVKEKILDTRIHEVVTVKEGANELLDLLKQKGSKLVLATSSFEDFATKIMKAVNMYHKFDIFLTENDVTNNKPDPEIFLRAVEQSGTGKESCIIYEDSYNGVKSALASSVYCVGIYNPGLNDKYIDRADSVIESFKDVIEIIPMSTSPY